MASRNISDLHPDLQPICEDFIKKCIQDGIDVLITCTFRSSQEQDIEYAKGRTIPGNIVTRAKGGQSAHNYMLSDGTYAAKAFDVVPLRHGKCVWGTKGQDLEIWQHIGKIGMDLGLNWYGRPDAPFREFPHFQMVE